MNLGSIGTRCYLELVSTERGSNECSGARGNIDIGHYLELISMEPGSVECDSATHPKAVDDIVNQSNC